MLKISLLNVVLRVIPESFLFIFASYLFYHKKFNKKRISISIIVFAFGTYCIRLLPIQFGVHTILCMVLYSFLLVSINDIPPMEGMQYSFILVFMLFTSEILSIFIINNIYGSNTKIILSNDVKNNICFIPSIVLFCLGILIGYRLLNIQRKKRRNA